VSRHHLIYTTAPRKSSKLFEIESRVLKSNKLNTHGPIQVDMDEVKLRNEFIPDGLEKRCRWKGSSGEENKFDGGKIRQKSILLPPGMEWNGLVPPPEIRRDSRRG
jgi:hypothetical protein